MLLQADAHENGVSGYCSAQGVGRFKPKFPEGLRQPDASACRRFVGVTLPVSTCTALGTALSGVCTGTPKLGAGTRPGA